MQEYFDNEHVSDKEEKQTTLESYVQRTKPIKKSPESTSIYKRSQ